jgi:hypothetical protein
MASVHSFPKGSTLKATTVIFINEVCSTVTVMSSRTLLSYHMHFTIFSAPPFQTL